MFPEIYQLSLNAFVFAFITFPESKTVFDVVIVVVTPNLIKEILVACFLKFEILQKMNLNLS